jgi:hypothetical protein
MTMSADLPDVWIDPVPDDDVDDLIEHLRSRLTALEAENAELRKAAKQAQTAAFEHAKHLCIECYEADPLGNGRSFAWADLLTAKDATTDLFSESTVEIACECYDGEGEK